MINYLKQNKYGRATFLPLTAIKGNNKISENLLNEQGVVGFADTLVEIDDTYKNLANYLLGRNLVVNNIDNAIILSKKYKQSLRIVTLEGDLISPGGSMSGGAYRNTSNLLGRRREISILEKSVKNLSIEITKLSNDREEKRNIRLHKRQALDETRIDLQNLSLKQNTLELNIEQLLGKKQNIQEGFEEYKNTITQINNNRHDFQDNIDKIKKVLINYERERFDYEQKKNQANFHLLEAQEKEQELQARQSTVKIRYSATIQKKDNLIENVKRLKAETEKLYMDKNNLEQSVQNSNDQIHLKEDELHTLENNIENEKNNINALEENISKKIEEKDKESKIHKELFSERERITREINELDKDLLRLNNQQERLSNQLEELTSHILETYELTYTSALGLRDATIKNISDTKKQVKELKDKMKGLGSINIDAIEEYKEISERYEFLTKQKDDLQKSEENLIAIINELEEGMRKQFSEKFEDIKSEFIKVFKELFGGGRASLSLTTGDDILDAGINITAEPPGKKLQNIMQLSGGEKALTAISLLFAIQNLKPSPFCLLDEIEAALDDANVIRYANYLKKLSKNTQFIVITHRRGTMNAADVLYGITMQEKGVSSLVAVSLIEDHLEG